MASASQSSMRHASGMYHQLRRLTPSSTVQKQHLRVSDLYMNTSCISSTRNLRQTFRFSNIRHSSSSATSSSSSSASAQISVHVAASSSGKGRKFNAEKNTFDYRPPDGQPLGLQVQGTIYQKRRARKDSGQDAYFAASVGQLSSVTAFGVADGVGGWVDQGVDPADFSHGICGYMAEAAFHWPKDSNNKGEILGPRRLLEIGYDATIQDPQILAGGTTACIAISDEQGRMRVANLGDSGFLHLRTGAIHHYSNPQTHAFNTPYQLSITPPEILTQAAIFGGLPLNDLPDRADVAEHRLQHGDVVILATDGVWDNLSPQDILHSVSKIMRDAGAWAKSDEKGITVTDQLTGLVQQSHSNDSNTQETNDLSHSTLQATIASSIVGEAKTASLDRKRDGPFAKAVQKEYPMERFHGGKVDDITVVVAIALNSSQNAETESLKAKL